MKKNILVKSAFCSLLLILLLQSTSFASSAKNKILFLPLKISSASESQPLIADTDLIMQNLSETKGLKTVSRSTAEKHLNYHKNWPPSSGNILKNLPMAGNFDYLAAGSLTSLDDGSLSLKVTLYELPEKADVQKAKTNPPVYFDKKAKSPDALPKILAELVDNLIAHVNRHSIIASIEIKGNKKIDTGAILNRIKSKPGEKYDTELLNSDLKNLFQLGYFDDIQIDVKDTDKGRAVFFKVKERAVIQKVLIEGHKKLKEDEIKEVITVKPNKIFNTKELRESIDAIKKLYKEKGYFNTKVTSGLNYPKPDRLIITFVIDEGPKVYVKTIKLVGNKAFSDRKLKKVMVTSEKGIFSWITESGVLKRDMLEHDAARITAFYHDKGYIEARVGEPEVKQEGKWLYITFNISEGRRFKVGTIDLTGDLIADKQILLDKLKLKDEKYFSRNILREDILRLTDFYAEKGFAFAEAYPSITKDDDLRVALVINIHKGHLVKINRIIIKGNTRTRDKVIRREMAIKEGGIFDAAAMRKSNEKIKRLDFFEEVNISPEPTLDENLMDVLVEVKEKPTGNFSIGAGYSSVDHVILMAEVNQNNLFGRGQRLSLQANISGTSTRYNLGFTEPHIFDTKLLFGIDLYNWQREYDDYTKDSKGFALRFGYPVWEKWYMFWSYGFDNTELSDVNELTASQYILDSMDIKKTSYVRLGFQRDTRDRLYDASKGSLYNISTKYAGGPLGGDSAFTKVQGSAAWFFPLFWKTTFHVKAASGYVHENSGGKLPVYEKFYLGGINTIRGFESGGISPEDPANGDKIGGDKMWYSNVEYIFPLVPSAGLKGVIFYDAGNVYGTDEGWNFSKLKQSVGYGFRWLSPMGPLRLEWGFNLHPEKDERTSSWDFTIGGAF